MTTSQTTSTSNLKTKGFGSDEQAVMDPKQGKIMKGWQVTEFGIPYLVMAFPGVGV